MSVVQELRRLEPGLRLGEDEATARRSLTADTWEQLQNLGIIRGLQPKRWGGGELPLREQLTNVYELARIAPAAGWVAGVVGSHPWQIAPVPRGGPAGPVGCQPRPHQLLLVRPDRQGRTVSGGYRVSGRWSFSSGGDHCQAVILGGIAGTFDIGGGVEIPNYGSILLLQDQYRIDDNWFTAGLSGTGSKDIVVEDAFVPEHRFLSHPRYEYNPANPAPGLAINPSNLYRLPWAVMFNLVLVAPVLGIDPPVP